MIKVRIDKLNGKVVEFSKEIELQLLPKKGHDIELEGNQYRVISVRQSPDYFIVEVKDKPDGGIKGLENLFS